MESSQEGEEGVGTRDKRPEKKANGSNERSMVSSFDCGESRVVFLIVRVLS